ncbi:MAG TPA: hypothetical protein VIA18_01265 [Polyangia bacterium]|nr:hypothetical protein [Polyangia bacterium]
MTRSSLAFCSASLLAVVASSSCGGGHGGGSDMTSPVPEFIVQDSDVAGFTSWYSQPFVADPLSDIVYPPGSRVGFINHLAPAGATAYPLGTIIIKAIENSTDPTTWELFGMSKRGGDYNAAGAVGWDFMLLRFQDGVPHIYSSGLTPIVDGNPDMGAINEGSYFAGGQIACDVCHGQKDYAPYDHIIDHPFELNRDAGPPDLAVVVPNDLATTDAAVDGGASM